MQPNDKVRINQKRGGSYDSDTTYAEFHLQNLTPEVLRDIARNESATREWRKAATKFLLDRKHPFANHPDVRELLAEILKEREAEQEVKAIVESAIEAPLEQSVERSD